ncbi:MAG: hypothetical protein GWP10_00955 [Nitrospiraceae bacterium]|nr:hypothetical protein [Nitrospiraceae bacterium]
MTFQSVTKKATLVLASLSLLCGCASVNMNFVDVGPPICLNDPTPIKVLIVKHFKREVSAQFGLFGFVTWRQPPLKTVLREELRKSHGNGIINISIKSRFSPADMPWILISPVWFPRSYTIEGDVVLIR